MSRPQRPCSDCGSMNHDTDSHEALERSYRAHQPMELDGQPPAWVRIVSAEEARIILLDQPVVLRGWLLKDGQSVTGLFIDSVAGEFGRAHEVSEPPRSPHDSQGVYAD